METSSVRFANQLSAPFAFQADGVENCGQFVKGVMTTGESFEVSCPVVQDTNFSNAKGVAVVDCDTGATIASLPWCPSFHIVRVVPQTMFRAEAIAYHSEEYFAEEFEGILGVLMRASALRSEELWAEMSTRSARLNEQFSPNECFQFLYPRLGSFDALGIVVDHDGTTSGLLFSESSEGAAHARHVAACLRETLAADWHVDVVRVAN